MIQPNVISSFATLTFWSPDGDQTDLAPEKLRQAARTGPPRPVDRSLFRGGAQRRFSLMGGLMEGRLATCFQAHRERPWMVKSTTSGDRVMGDTMSAQLDEVRAMGADLLRRRYRDLFGDEAQTTDKNYLRRRIAWQMQASAEGDISDNARRRALEIVRDVELKGRVLFEHTLKKKNGKRTDRRLPGPGTELTRIYGNRTIVAKILDNGFECEGQHYSSLSAAAGAVTGTRWNGLVFFGLAKRGETAKRKRRKPTQPKGEVGNRRREASHAA